MNLALDALDAMEEAAHRQRTLRILTERGMAVVEVSDTGVGIPADDMQRIFDPFFTTQRIGADREPEGASVPVLRKPLAPATLIARVRAVLDDRHG
jgi:signal transduction histidine kinase